MRYSRQSRVYEPWRLCERCFSPPSVSSFHHFLLALSLTITADRAALYVVKDAEEKGLISPGGTIIEGTAGNTGIGLAHVCRSKGYKCKIYMPDTQSQGKIDLLRLL